MAGAWAAGGCGAPPGPVSADAGGWALEEVARLPLSVNACATGAKVVCPRGGTIERPGISAVLVAQAQGSSQGRFVFTTCDLGDQPVSGTLWVQLKSDGGRVVPTHYQGRLRLHGQGGRICEVDLAPAPSDDHPWAHTGSVCGQERQILGPRQLQGEHPSGMLGPPGRP